VLTIIIVLPRDYQTPLKPNLEVIQNELISQNKELVLRRIIRGYTEAIAHNNKINKKKVFVLRAGFVVLPIVVILMILLVFIS
jgi:hypothetical protein